MSHKTPDADRAGSGRVSQTAPKEKSVSAGVWEALESQPGFNEAITEGAAQIAAGRAVRLDAVRAGP